MRAIIEIFLAIIFSVVVGSGSLKVINAKVKKEAIVKVSGGLGSLEYFTQRLTE